VPRREPPFDQWGLFGPDQRCILGATLQHIPALGWMAKATIKHGGVRLVEIRGCECRWIEGPADAEALCCGALTDGGSWCSYHRDRVFDRRHRRARPAEGLGENRRA